ncbi:MAG: restriction endonuclease subunit S, partial [Candidatus Thorarchaeota archaeon]
DELIGKKRRQIELLKEQRQAVINQAVTKGLDPNVEMKDSGIEWLGEIPEHWAVKKLKYVSIINPSKSDSQYNHNDTAIVTFLPMERVGVDGSFDKTLQKPINELWNGFTYFEEGDVIVAKITPCFENGKGAYLEGLGSEVGFGSTEFHVLRAIDGTSCAKFLYYLTKSEAFRQMGQELMYGAAGQKRVPTEFLYEFICAIPNCDEQVEIVGYIDRQLSEMTNACSKAEKQIQLLQEYRTALISEAVTGKIDVRQEG